MLNSDEIERVTERNGRVFVEKRFDFSFPQEIHTAIENLKNAYLDNSSLLDCYIEELRAFVHFNTDGEDGVTEEQWEEIIDYYYRRRYKGKRN